MLEETALEELLVAVVVIEDHFARRPLLKHPHLPLQQRRHLELHRKMLGHLLQLQG